VFIVSPSGLCRVEEYPGKNADNLVNRRLAQVYTPGTVLDGHMLVSAEAAACLWGACTEVLEEQLVFVHCARGWAAAPLDGRHYLICHPSTHGSETLLSS
jgi:hypothetical protein